MKMTRKLKDAWLEGLRTLPQGNGYLKGPNGFCCLGVFQNVRGAPITNANYIKANGATEYDYSVTSLGRHTMEEFQCHKGGFNITREDVPERLKTIYDRRVSNGNNIPETDLMWLNDSGATFEEIAKLVEKYVEVTDEAPNAEQA